MTRTRIIHQDRDNRGPATPVGDSYEATFTVCAPQGTETDRGWTRYYRATNNPAGVTCTKCIARR